MQAPSTVIPLCTLVLVDAQIFYLIWYLFMLFPLPGTFIIHTPTSVPPIQLRESQDRVSTKVILEAT